MTIEAITSHIQHLDWIQNPTISYLASGYGNDNYRIDDGAAIYVCRVKKTTEFPDSLFHEYALYRFLEIKGHYFCPRAHHITADGTLLIESYIEGNEQKHSDFTKTKITQFASQLHTLNSLPLEQLQQFCRDENIPPFEIRTPIDSLQVYGFDRYQEIKTEIVDQDIVHWLQEKLEACKKDIEQRSTSATPHLLWGDVQSSVLCSNDTHMYFFDFEHTHIGYGTDLSYINIHSSFTPQQFAFLVKEYARVATCSESELWKQIEQNEHVTRVNDVVWAALKWSETNDDTFKRLTYERKKLVSNG